MSFNLFYKHLAIVLHNNCNEQEEIKIEKIMEILPHCKINKKMAREIIQELEKRKYLKMTGSIHSPKGIRFKVKNVSTL